MSSVSVKSPKTPVTEGSNGVAAATLPNVCKMPGPPAPFVPTPLPNIGKSGQDPKNYSKSVTIEGKRVAIRGATFGSMGDVASKGTGGGLVSANVEGPASFVGPGSMDVKIEGKNVHLLGDPMLNNCGPSGSPANSATLMGVIQETGFVKVVNEKDKCPVCDGQHGSLQESEETKSSAQELARKFESRVHKSIERKTRPGDDSKGDPGGESNLFATMLGVVQCECKKWKYGEQSGVTLREFYDSVKELGSGWQAPNEKDVFVEEPPAGRDGRATREAVFSFLYQRYADQERRVAAALRAATSRFDKFRQKKAQLTAYPPGSCAGPKALLLALQHGAYAGCLTEQWFGGTQKKPTKEKIKFHHEKTAQDDERQFEHGETVPPCGACELILPLMLCPGSERPKCSHKTESSK